MYRWIKVVVKLVLLSFVVAFAFVSHAHLEWWLFYPFFIVLFAERVLDLKDTAEL